jgi:hypothetical protein
VNQGAAEVAALTKDVATGLGSVALSLELRTAHVSPNPRRDSLPFSRRLEIRLPRVTRRIETCPLRFGAHRPCTITIDTKAIRCENRRGQEQHC